MIVTALRRSCVAVLAITLVAGALGCSAPTESPDSAKQKLKAMLDKGRIDDISDTNFVYCAFMGDIEAVKLYLAAGTDVNARNDLGRTALIGAAGVDSSSPWSGKGEEVTRLLISKGADVNARDNDGQTAMMIATTMGRPGIVKILHEAGATE